MQIDFVQTDEENWVGIYFDGELVYQDKEITCSDFIDLLIEQGILDVEKRNLWVNQEWFNDEAHTLPDFLDEVKLSVEE